MIESVVNGIAGEGADFLINTFIGGYQHQPRVLALPGGGFVVIWNSQLPHINSAVQTPYARFLGPDGTPAGDDFMLNPEMPRAAIPALVPVPTGGYIGIWGGTDGDGPGIHLRYFDDDLVPVSPIFLLNDVTAGYQVGTFNARNGAGVTIFA